MMFERLDQEAIGFTIANLIEASPGTTFEISTSGNAFILPLSWGLGLNYFRNGVAQCPVDDIKVSYNDIWWATKNDCPMGPVSKIIVTSVP